jgi:hypothetical protein
MATTINSGYANSPKLTANIADHADVYGGRALVFDGVSDYLDCGTGLGNQLGDNYSGGLSVSMWINVNSSYSSGEKGIFFLGNFGGSYGELSITINPTNLNLYLNQNAWQKQYTFSARNTWTHICYVADSQSESNTKFYINGEEQSIATNVANTFPSSGDLDFTGLKTVIGNFFNGNYPFHGKITDTKVFNSTLTEAQVQELYLKPENTPSAVQDNLVAWYPMIEGNPESPQSIVYDHSEKKLGSDTFGGLNQWSPKVVDREVISVSGDELTLTVPSANDAGMNTGNLANLGLSTSLGYAVGDLVKLQFDAKIVTNGSGFGETVRFYDVNEYVFSAINISLTSEYQTFTFYGVISNLGYSIPSFLRMGNRTGTDVYNLKNFSVQKVLMGNHATTNFFGDDLQTGTWNNSDLVGFTGASANGFTAVNTNANVGNDDNAYGDEISFVAGKTYQMSFTLAINSGSIGSIFVGVTSGTAGSADSILSYTLISSANDYSYTFTPTSTVTRRPSFRFVVNCAYNFTISNFSVKEVGVSSSGFDTAVNEPVVPQVPLMKYNQKMLVPSNESTNTYVHLPDGLTAGLTEITISLWFQKIKSGDSLVTLFAVDGGGTYFRDTGNNKITCHMPFDNSGNPFTSFAFPSDLAPHHYVFTVKSNSQQVYRDGVKVHSTTVTTTTMSHNIRRIGNYAGFQDTSMADEFAIFNKHFTQEEAQELFNDGVALDATTHSKKGNLLGYWRNDGVTTWKDRRGWSFLDFDGSSDEVTLDSELTFSGVFSVSFWVKHNSSGTEYVLGKVGGDQDYFYAHPTHPRWRINDVITSSNTAMAVGVWHHVLGVRDSSNVLKWYLNGSAGTLYNGSSYVTTGVTRSGDFDVQYFGRSLNTYGEIELTNVAFFNTDKSSSASTFYNNGLAYDYTTESGITNYYKMDSSSTLLDRVGSVNGTVDATLNTGNDGSVQGSPDSITIREGLNSNKDGLGFYFTNPSSNVLRLNGIDEQIIVPDTDFNFSSQMTFECWAKNNSDNNTVNEFLISQYDYDNNQRAFRAFIHSNGALYCTVSASGGSTISQVNTTNAISNLDNWHHYAFTFSSGTFVIYIDGAVATISTGSVVASVTSIHNSTADIQIGSSYPPNATGGEWNGLIDEIKIYNRALSADEITKNYKHQKGKHKND